MTKTNYSKMEMMIKVMNFNQLDLGKELAKNLKIIIKIHSIKTENHQLMFNQTLFSDIEAKIVEIMSNI